MKVSSEAANKQEREKLYVCFLFSELLSGRKEPEKRANKQKTRQDEKYKLKWSECEKKKKSTEAKARETRSKSVRET